MPETLTAGTAPASRGSRKRATTTTAEARNRISERAERIKQAPKQTTETAGTVGNKAHLVVQAKRSGQATSIKQVKAAQPVASTNLAKRAAAEEPQNELIVYRTKIGLLHFAKLVFGATPAQIAATERQGVNSVILKDLSAGLGVPSIHLYKMLGVPKATAEKKVATNGYLAGAPGMSAIGLTKLLAQAESIVANSTSEAAKNFDVPKWLGQWIERPQNALGGKKPSELLDTPTGIEMVSKVLGAIESGAYL